VSEDGDEDDHDADWRRSAETGPPSRAGFFLSGDQQEARQIV